MYIYIYMDFYCRRDTDLTVRHGLHNNSKSDFHCKSDLHCCTCSHTTRHAKLVRWLQKHITMSLSSESSVRHPSVVQLPRPPARLSEIILQSQTENYVDKYSRSPFKPCKCYIKQHGRQIYGKALSITR